MSYVPATFTAGFALVLTAAGAVGGQWVSDIRQAAESSVPTEARVSQVRRTAEIRHPEAPKAAPRAPRIAFELSASLASAPAIVKRRELVKPVTKDGSNRSPMKSMVEPKAPTIAKVLDRSGTVGVPMQARLDVGDRGGRKVFVRN